jgi:hypothetical protein
MWSGVPRVQHVGDHVGGPFGLLGGRGDQLGRLVEEPGAVVPFDASKSGGVHRERVAGVVKRLGLFVAEPIDHAPPPSPVGETDGQTHGRLTTLAFRRSGPRRSGMTVVTHVGTDAPAAHSCSSEQSDRNIDRDGQGDRQDETAGSASEDADPATVRPAASCQEGHARVYRSLSSASYGSGLPDLARPRESR